MKIYLQDQPPAEPIPRGRLPAVLAMHFDLGIHQDYPNERPKPKVALLFELAERRADGQRFTIGKEFTASLYDTANLRAFLEDWRGAPFSEAELERFKAEGFALEALHGKPCTLTIADKPRRTGRGCYAEIIGIARALRGAPELLVETPETYVPDWVALRMSEALPPEALGDDPGLVEEIPF
jgi:hypothetical protein